MYKPRAYKQQFMVEHKEPSRKNMIVSPKLSPGTSDTKFEDTSLSRFFLPRDPKFNTSFCNYFVSESGIFGVPLQNQLQDDKVRNEKASIPPFYTEVRTTT